MTLALCVLVVSLDLRQSAEPADALGARPLSLGWVLVSPERIGGWSPPCRCRTLRLCRLNTVQPCRATR